MALMVMVMFAADHGGTTAAEHWGRGGLNAASAIALVHESDVSEVNMVLAVPLKQVGTFGL